MASMTKKSKQDEELLSLFADALASLKSGKPLEGQDGAVRPLIKRLIEASLEGEMDNHLSECRPNRRNGKGQKQIKTSVGAISIETPRDREGSYQPELIPKRQRTLGPSLEKKIIGLYSLGMSYKNISDHIMEMYGMELSASQLTAITDRIWPQIEEWKKRPLDEVYPFVWLDALFYKVRQEGQIKSMAAYMVLGMNTEGQKDLLGIYLAETESSRFWLQVLSDLKERGIKDIFIACIDNLRGFKEAIVALFPNTEVQLCIVHQVRNSVRYVPYRERSKVVADMKAIYKAPGLDQAEYALEEFETRWGKKYAAMVKSWKHNWEGLVSFYNYPQQIRTIMYTTNSIEGFNRQIRKATKTKGSLPSERALYKLLYLTSQSISKNWSTPRSWTNVMAIFGITHADRLPNK